MEKTNVVSRSRLLALTGIMAAVAVAGSIFVVIPLPFARCAPIQHMVNVLCAVLLGPKMGVLAAFIASTVRILLGVGTFVAYPGSMCGAFLSGILYARFHTLRAALIGEVVGTGIIGGLLAFPVSAYLLGNNDIAAYMFIGPFLVSTLAGSTIAGLLLKTISKRIVDV